MLYLPPPTTTTPADEYSRIDCNNTGCGLRQGNHIEKLFLINPMLPIDHLALYERNHSIASAKRECANLEIRPKELKESNHTAFRRTTLPLIGVKRYFFSASCCLTNFTSVSIATLLCPPCGIIRSA